MSLVKIRFRHEVIRCYPGWLIRILIFISLMCLADDPYLSARQQSEPEVFTYDELVQLYEQENLPPPLAEKLKQLLTTPFVHNGATTGGATPQLSRTKRLGSFVRVVEWNIERGLEFEAIKRAFTGPESFSPLIDKVEFPKGSQKRKLILQQVALLKQADIIVLNEVDFGMKRTDYRNVAADLAAALNMNYAYGVEFVEVDPIVLGLEKFEELSPDERRGLAGEISVDRALLKGLHGTAILSRFTLDNVRLEPFEHQPHDWYADELKSVSPLEEGKRKAGELIFQEKVRREVRRGGRMMLTAEISDARLPGGRITVVATHLEDKTRPEGRRQQLEELLARIKDAHWPVIIAGDMNTSTQDSTPTSIERELKKRLGSKSFWIKQGLEILTGVKLPTLLLGGLNTYRKQADPTVKNVPLIAPNPESEFFDRIKEFHFADGGAFDFRGERLRSVGHKTAPLANSNQRGGKGFITTYEVERSIGFIGRFKLDWFFIKPPFLREPYGENQPHVFAPHFGRTLKSLNESLKDRISDHSPLVVDLPLDEPLLRHLRRPIGSRTLQNPQRRRSREGGR